MGWQEDLRAKREATERWIRQRAQEVERGAHDLEARGRKIYGDAVRTGRQVLARTPEEVKQLARAAAQGRLPEEAAKMAVKAATPIAKRVVAEAKTPAGRVRLVEGVADEVRAAASGAVDEASFGLADRVLAGGDALRDAIARHDLTKVGDLYDASMTRKRAEDAYDASHHTVARAIGQAAGFASSFAIAPAGAARLAKVGAAIAKTERARALLEPAEALLRAKAGPVTESITKALAQRARAAARVETRHRNKGTLDPRGLHKLVGGGGALLGVSGQAVGDVARGEFGTPGDYVGAALGGAVGGFAAMRGGGARGGAAEGVATSVAQDVLNGRAPDVGHALEASRAGYLLGGISGREAELAIANASTAQKGKVGELFSQAKQYARGEIPLSKQAQPIGSKRSVIPDWQVSDEFIDAKMGPYADTTPNQRIFEAQNPGRLFVDYWRFKDVGKAASAPAAALGMQLPSSRARERESG